ncbi:MAG: AEC family transporter [Clostridia bacterium]|nr:AEC family transporter [Clostridia bacterium]
MDIFSVIMKMAMLVILMLAGYVCAKCGVTGPDFNKAVSPVVMNVLLVGTILNSVINIQPTLTAAQIFLFFGLMLAMFIVLAVLSWLFPALFRIKGGDTGVARCVLLFMNSGFVGLPVVQVVFGTEAVFYASLSNIPFNILLYTVGMAQLRSRPGERFDYKQILSVPMIVTFLAILIFAFRWPVPTVLADTISSMAGATIPMSMLIIGTSLGGIPLKTAFGDWRAYALSAVKLIVQPIAVWAVLRCFLSNPMMLGILVILAACPTGMIITVLCVQNELDEALASKTIFLSTVLSGATIPFILWLLL